MMNKEEIVKLIDDSLVNLTGRLIYPSAYHCGERLYNILLKANVLSEGREFYIAIDSDGKPHFVDKETKHMISSEVLHLREVLQEPGREGDYTGPGKYRFNSEGRLDNPDQDNPQPEKDLEKRVELLEKKVEWLYVKLCNHTISEHNYYIDFHDEWKSLTEES